MSPPGSGDGRYLAFDVSVLRRLKFESVAIPFSGGPDLGWYLKLWRKRVFANDIARWAWWSNRALVENNVDRLAEADASALVDGLDAPVSRVDGLLGAWLESEDASWFTALRDRIETVESSGRRALAIRAAFRAMDYAIAVPRRSG